MIPFIRNVQNRQTYGDRKQTDDYLGLGVLRGGDIADEQERSFQGDGNVLKQECGHGYSIFNLLKTELYFQKEKERKKERKEGRKEGRGKKERKKERERNKWKK